MTEAAESVVSAKLLAMRFERGAVNKLNVSMRLAMGGDKQQHLYPHPRIRALREDVTFLHRVNASPYVSPGFSMEGGNLAMLANIHKDPVVDTTIGLQASLRDPQDVAAEAPAVGPTVPPVANAAPTEPDDAAVDHMMAPCYHLCLCAGCAPRVRSGRMPCPVCRLAQRSIIRVF